MFHVGKNENIGVCNICKTCYSENKIKEGLFGSIIMNTREYGKRLEYYVAEKFKEIGYKNACPSNGSGQCGSIGDISGVKDWACECKVRNTKDITIKQDVWDKLNAEIPLASERLPLYILENKNKRRWAVIEIEDFFRLLGKIND